MEKVGAILFDVDGVLVDAADWHFDALNLSLADFGIGISHKQHHEEFLGLPTKVKIDMLVERRVLRAEARDIVITSKRRIFREMVRERCRPEGERIQLLAALRAQEILLAAVSNAVKESVLEMLDLAGLKSFFDLIVCADEVSEPKPSPAIYLKCIQQLGVRPEQTVVLEDGRLGLEAARAAGIKTFKVKEVAEVNLQNLSPPLLGRGDVNHIVPARHGEEGGWERSERERSVAISNNAEDAGNI